MDDMVAAYRELYPGAFIFRACCAAKESFGLRCECAVGVHAAAEAWKQAPPGAKPRLLVHLCSNAGFMTWTEMLRLWQAVSSREEPHPMLGSALPPMEQVLRGVVLDSAPNAEITIGPCVQSMAQGLAPFLFQVASADHDGSDAGRKEAELRARKLVVIIIGHESPVKACLLRKPERTITKQSCADAARVHRLEPPVPLQFIYSADDKIILANGVEKYIGEVKSRPTRKGFPPPRTLKFDRSPHCLHKMEHAEEYWRCARLFAGNVLGKE